MTTSFPAALDAPTNPTGASDLDDPAVLHSAQHANVNDAVEALEAKVGVDGSAVTSSLDYKAAHLRTDVDALDGRVDTLETNAVASLDDLSDVDTTTTPPADGDRLAFDIASGLWLPTAAAAGMLALDDLTDVDLTTTAPSDGDTLVFDSASGDWLPVASGVSGTGGILAVTSYQPAADGTVLNGGTSGSAADVDATNLVVTFTAPASGNVLVRLEAPVTKAGGGQGYWGLRAGASDVVAPQVVSDYSSSGFARCTEAFYIAGLTAGTSYTYKWSYKVSTGSMYIYGGPTYGKSLMIVEACP